MLFCSSYLSVREKRTEYNSEQMAQQQYIEILDTFEDVTGLNIKSKDVSKDTTPNELEGVRYQIRKNSLEWPTCYRFSTNNVLPDTLFLYLTENRSDLITHYRLKPNDEGPIYVYQKFWDNLNLEFDDQIVPPVLVYADLVTSYDPRILEIANQIYEEFIKSKLEDFDGVKPHTV